MTWTKMHPTQPQPQANKLKLYCLAFLPPLKGSSLSSCMPTSSQKSLDFMSLLTSPCRGHWHERDEVIVSRSRGSEGKAEILMRNVLLSQNLFSAGTDTTSSTVEWALAELIKHPNILRKAQFELDSVVGRDRLVSESDLPNLPFIQAIVKETFRLHPSTPLSLPRMAAEACEVAGYYIPKGATLLVNVWAIARDPAVWHDPLEFRPARFLPDGGYEQMDVKGNDFGIIPFGAGRRICAGMSLGIRMVQFMTATLVHAFDWALPEGQMVEKLDMEEAYGLTLQRAVPLMVHPVPRLAPTAYQT